MSIEFDARKALIDLSLIYDGDNRKIINAINKRDFSGNAKTIREVDYDTLKCITLVDADYPEKLKETFNQPIVVYYEGNLDLLKDDNIVYVCGSRSCSNDGVKAITKLIRDLDATVLVGLDGSSSGVSNKVIKEAKRVIGILPYGIDYKGIPLDVENISHILHKDGLILSEYPFDTPKSQERCAETKRIKTGLCNKMLLIECKRNSSLLADVSMMASGQKPVYVVPKSINDSDDFMNNELLYEGANPCHRQDILLEKEVN